MRPGREITREIMGNVPVSLQVAFYIVVFVACGLAAYALLRRARQRRRSKDVPPEPDHHRSRIARIGSVLSYLTFHRELLRDRYAGLAHLLMFYGFCILFAGTCLVFLEHSTPLHFFHGSFYLVASLVIDLGGVAFIAGLAVFLGRRMGGGGKRILSAWWVAMLAWLLLAIGVTGFLLEGARIARHMPGFERWSAVGYAVALGFRALGIQSDAAILPHRVMWVAHAVFCVAFFALVPWRFFGHMAYGAMSWATRSEKPLGKLRLPQPGSRAPGAVTAREFARRDLLQVDACTTCGRCNEVCPAHVAGKTLRPREVVLGLRAAFDAEVAAAGRGSTNDARAGTVALSTYVADDMLWSCTSCGACDEACPVGIEVLGKIVEGRRGLVEAGSVPEAAEKVFESTAAEFNPYGKVGSDRLAWAAGIDIPVAREGESIELLYWIGCAGSFDPDGQAVSRSMVRILDHLGINYRVLGRRECCTGDPARRMGEEGLFQQLARQNIERFERHSVSRVLTHCPHCFNTFKNEYPELGAGFEVEHHSQFLARMIRQQRLRLSSGHAETVVFHDPCYLARGNGETRAPREVLAALGKIRLKEMPRNRERTFCCGAGGGSMWLDLPGTARIENLRAAEAAATGATIVATGCPFCKTMLEAGRQSLESGGSALRVKDLAELVVEAQGL
ncbi:MAG: (Fe-S)-binding protein [Acidobacteriota bacterium]